MTKKDRRTSYCLVFKTQYEAGKKKKWQSFEMLCRCVWECFFYSKEMGNESRAVCFF